MRSLVRGLATLLFATAVLAPTAGCSEKTDCKKLAERMNACSEPLWSALEPQLAGRMPENFRARRNAAHHQYCKKIKGVYKQSAKINACLKETACAKFADCFCRAVKKDSECGRAK